MITINLGGGGGGGGVEEVAVESAGLSSAFFSPELQESRKAVMLISIANGMGETSIVSFVYLFEFEKCRAGRKRAKVSMPNVNRFQGIQRNCSQFNKAGGFCISIHDTAIVDQQFFTGTDIPQGFKIIAVVDGDDVGGIGMIEEERKVHLLETGCRYEIVVFIKQTIIANQELRMRRNASTSALLTVIIPPPDRVCRTYRGIPSEYPYGEHANAFNQGWRSITQLLLASSFSKFLCS